MEVLHTNCEKHASEITDLKHVTSLTLLRLESMEEELKSLKKLYKAINEMGTSLAIMTEKMMKLETTLTKVEGNVENIIRGPGKKYETISAVIVTAVITSILGYVFANILK